jgi:ABC-type sugar transport system permease subunit
MDQTVVPDRRRGTSPAAGPATRAVRPPQRSWRRIFDNRLLPILLITPALVVIGGLVGYPVLRTAWLSVNDASGLQALTTGAMSFTGLDNYVTIAQDPDLRRSAITTVLFGLSCVVATMLVGMAVALLLNRPFKGRVILGIIVLLPWAIPHVAASYVWQWLFHDQYGVVNWTLATLGLGGFEGFAWFNQWHTAFVVVGIVVVWQSFPFVSIALLAGLQTVPADVLEAATIDGASAWQRTRLVTLPMLKPLLLVLLVISTIWDFKVFDQVFVLTGGGPARKTEILTISTYQQAFTQSEFGLGSALAMVLFLILLVVTVIYIKLVKDEERVS